MFIHLLKYRVKTFLRPSEELFWSIVFPFILGTFFYMAFGNISEATETFKTIDVAIVEEQTPNAFLTSFLDSISTDGDSKLINITKANKDQALELLKQEEVTGIITITDHLKLTVLKEGLEQSILQGILDTYNHTANTVENLAATDPSKVLSIVKELNSSLNCNKEITLSEKNNLDTMTSYFYALIAMASMFASFWGYRSAISIQGNLSALAARRTITPTHKMKVILSDYLASLLIQSIASFALIVYLNYVLGVEFGDQLPFVFLTSFVGNIIGISFGLFISSLGHFKENTKLSIVLSVSMILCFLSGLMVNSMKDIIERACPIINRLNPAALITDALYSLSIYDTYDRYIMNMSILSIMAVVLCFLSFLATRRVRYASI